MTLAPWLPALLLPYFFCAQPGAGAVTIVCCSVPEMELLLLPQRKHVSAAAAPALEEDVQW